MASYHYRGFTQAGAEVIAIADTNVERAQAFGKEREIPKYYHSLSEMLSENPDINAVSVITPNKFHKALVIEALEKGKHVYCEKPPALNAVEMNEMREASVKAERILLFDLKNRARPEAQAMIRYIREGRTGRINSAQANWTRRNGVPGFGGWFTNKAISGGGPVLDLLHMTDLALWFMEYPEPEFILGATYHDFMDNHAFKGPWGFPDVAGGITDVESACQAMVVFKTGQSLLIRSSWAELNERETISVTFQGVKAGGKLERLFEIDGQDETSTDQCSLFIEEFGNQVDLNIKTKKDEHMGRINMAANFINAIEGREDPYNTPDEALILMRIIDGIYKSAETRQPVKIG
jgi:predicted dehydrogenase